MHRWLWLIVAAGVAGGAYDADARTAWKTYTNCTMRPNEWNDGDSFHVKYKNRHYIFRLNFVDTPETDPELKDRIQEQAEYFNIHESEVIHMGKKAGDFTQKMLADGFTVYSQLDDAMGRSERKRYFGMVTVGDQDLGDALVANGLARIYGQFEDVLPDGGSGNSYVVHLKSLEKKARDQRLGCWDPRLRRNTNRVGNATGPAPFMPSASVGYRPPAAVAPPPSLAPMTIPPPAWAPPGTAPAAPTAPDPLAMTREPPTAAIDPLQPATAGAPPPAVSGAITPHLRTLGVPTPVYSLVRENAQVGTLRAGAQVKVLEVLPDGMIRIRFMAGENRVLEAKCRRADLGL